MTAPEPSPPTVHLWGSVTRTRCGLDAFRVYGTHVAMTEPILRVVDERDDATCPGCLADE